MNYKNIVQSLQVALSLLPRTRSPPHERRALLCMYAYVYV